MTVKRREPNTRDNITKPNLYLIKDKKEDKEEKLSLAEKAYIEEMDWREEQVAKVFKEGRNRAGRPTKCTEEVIRDAEVLARIGLSEKAIAESLMIAPTTLIQWLKKDSKFSNRVKKAREKGKTVLVNSIYGHGRRNWQATAWLLERMYRNEFALDSKQKMEVTGAGGAPITLKIVYVKSKKSED